MKKAEFLERLAQELEKRNVADAEDIVEEYAQHFAFKMADGFPEEVIAAKLGDPAGLAAQFGELPQTVKGKSPALTWLWLVWADLFFGVLAVLLLAWGVVMAACVLSFGLTGVCLAGGLDRFPLVSLPPMPYSCGLLLGLALLALTVACVVGCVYYFGFIRQLFRAYGRFHQNALAAPKGEPVLPPLPIHPQFLPAHRRRLRMALIVSFVCFGVFFVLGMALAMLLAGSFQFWHTWGWFGYNG